MTDHALRPAGIVPRQLASPLRCRDGELAIHPLFGDQRRVGLIVVPEVRIADPFVLLLRQVAGFNPALRCGIALDHLQPERLDEHRFIREPPRFGAVGEVEFGIVAGDGDEPRLERTVRPQRRVHRVRDQRRLGDVPLHRLKQPALAELLGKVRGRLADGRGNQPMETAVAVPRVIADQQLAVRISPKPGDVEWRVDEFLMPRDLLSVVTRTPDLPRGVIAVEIRSDQARQFLAVVDDPAGQRPRFGMMMLKRGLHMRRRSHLPGQIERMASLVDAPAVVVPLPHEVDLLPQVLTVVADPDVARLAVGGHPPRIAQSVRPRLRNDVGLSDKRVVHRYRISLARRGMIDVETQHLGGQLRQILTTQVGVAVGGAVARRDIHQAVVAERDRGPVVSVGRPLDDRRFAGGIEFIRRLGVQLEPRNDRVLHSVSLFGSVRPFRPVRPFHLRSIVTHVDIPVV